MYNLASVFSCVFSLFFYAEMYGQTGGCISQFALFNVRVHVRGRQLHLSKGLNFSKKTLWGLDFQIKKIYIFKHN